MPLRFFADHCISNSIIQELRDAGYEVLRLKDHIPIESPDRLVLSTAQELNSILLSLNGDFTREASSCWKSIESGFKNNYLMSSPSESKRVEERHNGAKVSGLETTAIWGHRNLGSGLDGLLPK
jgi:hypothetical protein